MNRASNKTARQRHLWYLAAAALWLALLLPLAASADNDQHHKVWTHIQLQADREERRDWWATLSPAELDRYLDAGVDIKLADKKGWTPLHSGARYSPNRSIVEMLIAHGADVNARNKAGDSPLHWAAAENPNPEVLVALLKSGANVNARDHFGWTPLLTAAATTRNWKSLDVLLVAGAKPRARAYFLLFSARFLLKHNPHLDDTDRALAMRALEGSRRSGAS